MFLVTDAIAMIRDIRAQGQAIGLWGGALNIPQLVGGLVFITHLEGQLVLAAEVLALAIAGQIHKRTPFSRLTGICHLPWLALLPWLVYRLQTIDHPAVLRSWIFYVAITIFLSLIFDARDLYRYARGDRTFAWAK
ncbi:MAG: hypothetical protein AAF441_27315 [Pseudomonadota bacterium]